MWLFPLTSSTLQVTGAVTRLTVYCAVTHIYAVGASTHYSRSAISAVGGFTHDPRSAIYGVETFAEEFRVTARAHHPAQSALNNLKTLSPLRRCPGIKALRTTLAALSMAWEPPRTTPAALSTACEPPRTTPTALSTAWKPSQRNSEALPARTTQPRAL